MFFGRDALGLAARRIVFLITIGCSPPASSPPSTPIPPSVSTSASISPGPPLHCGVFVAGRPGDADGDNVPDDEDQCPCEPGDPSIPFGRPPCQNGCPFDTRLDCARHGGD